jgi:hypothetical protein
VQPISDGCSTVEGKISSQLRPLWMLKILRHRLAFLAIAAFRVPTVHSAHLSLPHRLILLTARRPNARVVPEDEYFSRTPLSRNCEKAMARIQNCTLVRRQSRLYDGGHFLNGPARSHSKQNAKTTNPSNMSRLDPSLDARHVSVTVDNGHCQGSQPAQLWDQGGTADDALAARKTESSACSLPKSRVESSRMQNNKQLRTKLSCGIHRNSSRRICRAAGSR